MSDQLVNNAADPSQVKAGKKREENKRFKDLNDLRIILNMPEGRRVFWRLLEHCSVFESIWHSSALIHKNAGRQDVGHFVMAEICEADQELYFKMQKENQLRKEKENE